MNGESTCPKCGEEMHGMAYCVQCIPRSPERQQREAELMASFKAWQESTGYVNREPKA